MLPQFVSCGRSPAHFHQSFYLFIMLPIHPPLSSGDNIIPPTKHVSEPYLYRNDTWKDSQTVASRWQTCWCIRPSHCFYTYNKNTLWRLFFYIAIYMSTSRWNLPCNIGSAPIRVNINGVPSINLLEYHLELCSSAIINMKCSCAFSGRLITCCGCLLGIRVRYLFSDVLWADYTPDLKGPVR